MSAIANPPVRRVEMIGNFWLWPAEDGADLPDPVLVLKELGVI